jgi:hypothetical protein
MDNFLAARMARRQRGLNHEAHEEHEGYLIALTRHSPESMDIVVVFVNFVVKFDPA